MPARRIRCSRRGWRCLTDAAVRALGQRGRGAGSARPPGRRGARRRAPTVPASDSQEPDERNGGDVRPFRVWKALLGLRRTVIEEVDFDDTGARFALWMNPERLTERHQQKLARVDTTHGSCRRSSERLRAARVSPNVTCEHRRRQRVTLGPHTSPNVPRSPAGGLDVTLRLARSERAGHTPTATATRARGIAPPRLTVPIERPTH